MAGGRARCLSRDPDSSQRPAAIRISRPSCAVKYQGILSPSAGVSSLKFCSGLLILLFAPSTLCSDQANKYRQVLEG